MYKTAQLFTSLDHAILLWTACINNAYLIYQSKKKNRLWYLSALNRSPANLHLPVIELQKDNSVENHFSLSKISSSKTDPMEKNYHLSKIEILTWENQVKAWQFQFQKSYHIKENKCNDFILAEWRHWKQNIVKIINKIGQYSYYYLINQSYNTHSKKLHLVYQLTIIPGKKHSLSVVSLEEKLKQVKAIYLELWTNQLPICAKNVYIGISKFTHIDIKKFETGFAHDLEYKRSI